MKSCRDSPSLYRICIILYSRVCSRRLRMCTDIDSLGLSLYPAPSRIFSTSAGSSSRNPPVLAENLSLSSSFSISIFISLSLSLSLFIHHTSISLSRYGGFPSGEGQFSLMFLAKSLDISPLYLTLLTLVIYQSIYLSTSILIYNFISLYFFISLFRYEVFHLRKDDSLSSVRLIPATLLSLIIYLVRSFYEGADQRILHPSIFTSPSLSIMIAEGQYSLSSVQL